MRSKASIAGHPIHPALVGFPVTCYVGTLCGFAVYAALGTTFWLNLAIALCAAGVGTAMLAAIPGLVDLVVAIPRGTYSKATGIAHAMCNLAALGLFGVVLADYAGHWDGPAADPTIGLTLATVGVLATALAGILGWRLVQTYHVGVRLTVIQEMDEPYVQALPQLLDLGIHERRSA